MSNKRAEDPSHASEHSSGPGQWAESHGLDNRDEGHLEHLPFLSPYSPYYHLQHATQIGIRSDDGRPNPLHTHQSYGPTLPLIEPDYSPQFTPINTQHSVNAQNSYSQQLQSHQSRRSTAEEASLSTRYASQQSSTFENDAATYDASLAANNGLKIPSKRKRSQSPRSTSSIRPLSKKRPRKHKPVRGKVHTWENEDDDARDPHDTSSSPPQHPNVPSQPTNPAPPPPPPPIPVDKRSERTKKTDASLAACNGVVTPSKLAPGTKVQKLSSKAVSNLALQFSCPVCGSQYGRTNHVKSHFPACVKRNGNPMGYCWDDLLE